MIQLCVKEDFPVSRCSLARLKGPTDQTQPFFIYISGLISSLNLLLAGDLLETYFLTLEASISLFYTLKLYVCFSFSYFLDFPRISYLLLEGLQSAPCLFQPF